MKLYKYNIAGDLVETLDVPPYGPAPKSVYTNDQFMDKIPSNKFKLIRASNNDDIEKWFDLIKILPVVDLNNRLGWFNAGLDAMVTDGIFTQAQINNFLGN